MKYAEVKFIEGRSEVIYIGEHGYIGLSNTQIVEELNRLNHNLDNADKIISELRNDKGVKS